MSRSLPDLSLYLVLGAADTGKRPFEEIVLAAIEGGVTVVQLRDKQASTRVLLEHALRLKALLEPRGVPLIVNDRIDVAMAARADGVHLGQDDMPPVIARRLVGEEMLIGLSVSDRVEADTADREIVDYCGIGSVFPTGTKSDAGEAIGPGFAQELRELVALPSVAIGGINAGNAGQLRGSGIEGLAVVSAICAADDPGAAAGELRRAYFG
jgi:thiamine-phosphate pyrophosphorylase